MRTGEATGIPRSRSVGVMGGTFDPIHLGHLAVAEEAREALGLGTILFVPAGIPPHKPAGAIAPIEDRVAMVELAIAGNPAFTLSRVDVDRAGPSYTSETMGLVRAAMAGDDEAGEDRGDPSSSGSIRLTLIMSTETLDGLPDWHDPRQLLEECRIAVVPREGHASPSSAWLAEHFSGLEGQFDLLTGPRLGISSTAIRHRVAAGRSIRYLAPEAVERYIADHHLYARANGAS